MEKVWQVSERLDPDLWQHLLKMRHLDTPEQQQLFFSPQLEQLISPHDFPDMDVAVARIAHAIDIGESMVVWGDFDADGVTSTAILWETLFQLGAKVKPYIPNRDAEGHGFSRAGLDQLAADGVQLIITCDHGITAFEDIEYARSLDMEVLVTDHHEPREGPEGIELPPAVAVIHPSRLKVPQPLAGCGVAYEMAYAVWLELQKRSDDGDSRLEFAQDRIELAAIGTIADMMPLTGHNRVLASIGLVALATTNRPGLQQMYQLAGMKPVDRVSMYEVGFVIGPRLNAPGRLGDALQSLRLLCTKELARAKGLAQELHQLNTQRQDMLQVVLGQARKALSGRSSLDAYVLANPEWQAGVCGLAAGRLVDHVYRPVVVMEQQGEIARGSARSIKGFDFTAALSSMSELLIHFGGHAMAAGFSAKVSDLPEIERRLSDLVRTQLSKEQLVPTLTIDAEVQLSEMTEDLWTNLSKLEPCGMGNPQAVFQLTGVEVMDCKTLGADQKHLKIQLVEDGQQIEAVAFGFGSSCDQVMLSKNINLAFNLDENVWNGRRSLQLKVKDLRMG